MERNMEAAQAALTKLDDPNLDLKSKCAVATELRDNLELWCQGSNYHTFLQKSVHVFMKLLDGQPVFINTSPEQRLRNCILEILHRLPMIPIDALEPYAVQIVDKLMSLVKIENEDNAVLCMKTIMDFLRHQTKALADRVQDFLDLIQEMFQVMEQVVKDTFDNPAQNPPQGVPSTPNNPQYSQSPRPGSPVASVSSDMGGEQQQARQLQKGMQSFKVLSECPIIVVSIFQAYRACVARNVKLFVPLIKNVLLLQAKPQEKAHADAKAQGKIFTGVSKDIKNRLAFGDFITAQVKTMSFLAYLLRVYAQQLTDFLPTLPDIVIRMLKDIPRERSGARKELLVAIRHIINFNFRKMFLKKIDELLDERTLLGDGLTVYETMRPLAYSMLADLIHHLRDSLSKEQIRKTVEVYTKNLHDDFPGTSFQTMSAKLLMNMAECIAKLENKQDARYFLIMILNAIGDKFAAMNRQFDNAVKLSAQYSPPSLDISAENYLANKDQPPDWDEIDIFNATPIKTSNPRERSSDPVADNKFLFKNLLHGLKNLFYQLRACNPPRIKEEIDAASAPANWHEVSFGYNAEEVQVLIKLFREGAHVFRYYGLDKPSTESQQLSPSELLATQQMMSSGKEEKELLETFATVFHHIDPASFHEVFQSEIPHLYEMTFDHAALLHIPQFLLASEATSPPFAGMLLQFLMDKIDEVGTADMKKSSILLRLFKLSFMAVTLFSTVNEQVLLPHVTNIITKSIQLSTTAEDPMNYFLLLRSLFRSIGGGKFEHLYKEILPLLEMLLDVLNNLLQSARKPQERDLFVELSLTVPARLSNLLPHLSYLMRPLVVALRAGSELVGQGLRTLELCVDNLTADYLDPIMAPVIDDLMAALWDHLRPNPYSHFHAHTTMRILGKLGGRNRKFLNGLPELSYKPYADDEASIDVRLIGSTRDRAFPAAIGVDSAISRLMEIPKLPAAKKTDGFYKQQAFRLITTHIKLLIGFDSLPDDFIQLVRLQANDLSEGKLNVGGEDLMAVSEREKSTTKRDVQQDTLKRLLKACMFATSLPDLRGDASTLVTNVARHFTVLEIGRALADLKHQRKAFDVTSGEGPFFIDSRVIADAIGESLASDEVQVREAAEEAIMSMRDAAAIIFGARDKVDRLPFFAHLAKVFTHDCYKEEWFVKGGGTLGIEIMVSKLDFSDAWLVERSMDFIRALMYVIKDMPQDVTVRVRVQAQKVLETIIGRCSKSMSKDDSSNEKSRLLALCNFLVFELAHMNEHVRKAAQRAFSIMAEVMGVEVHELITPCKDRLLVPIFNKPLRTLPFGTQIGYIDAITFCLKLQHGVLEFNEQLTRLLVECLALADADDETLAQKPQEQRNAESIVNLRVACIRLLSTAQNFPEFGSSPPNQGRVRIISVFFKSLYSRSPKVVEAANIGLQGVLAAQNKLPKDLLQNGLRPILMNLQDPRKLTVEGLEGLARLLKLLTNYFKVEIGSRLLDHMRTLADSATLQKVSFTLIEQNRTMRVITAILNVFHLLPAAAITFLPALVKKVIELETALRRTHFSPFREPLIRYLNHYPKEAWDHFAPLLRDHAQGRFFAQLLAHPASAPLREVVTQDVQGFMSAFMFDSYEIERCSAAANAIHVVWSISQHPETKNWLVSHEDLRKALFDSGKALESKLKLNTLDTSLRLAAEQAGDQLMKSFTIYLTQDPQNLDFFFEVIDAVTAEELKSSPALVDFIYHHMVSSDSIDYWRVLIMRSIELFAARNTSQKAKTFTFRYVVNPIFAMDVMRNWENLFGTAKGTKFVDKALTEVILNKLWRPQSTIDPTEETGQLGVDHSRMELLQLTTLLLKHYPTHMQEYRKDVIRFVWHYIKLEDIINKHAAYVVIGYFINHYDTPVKIALQVYQALLKAHQNEGRALVTQALELIAPVLKKRLDASDNRGLPLSARTPRRILTEESSNLQQLTSIFNFLVRHPDLFYEARQSLSAVVIPSLGKIAQPPTPSNESKRIALNLINLIWQWEQRAYREAAQSPDSQSGSPQSLKRKADGSVTAPTARPRAFVAEAPFRLMLIKYLVQFIAFLPERYPVSSVKIREATAYHSMQPSQSSEACRKAVQLLHGLLSQAYWSDLDIDTMFPKITEPVLTGDPPADEKPEVWTTKTINVLQILKVVVNVRPVEWVLNRITQLQKLLEKPVRCENIEIQDCLHSVEEDYESSAKMQPLIKRILDAIPEPASDEDGNVEDSPGAEFVTFCSTVAGEGLSNGNLIGPINLLWTLSQRRPDEIDQHVPQLMKAFTTKLAKEHLAAYAPQQPAMPNALRPGEPVTNAPDALELEIQTGLILKVIDILAARISHLGDQRRPFLSALASLVERSHSNAICLKILDLVEYWVFNFGEPVPTLKEKTAVLHKMLLFEHRVDNTLLNRFFELVIRMYEDPKITRTELTVRMEHAFLIGTRAQDVETRSRFMSIFDKSLSRSASARLNYLITTQDWSTLADTFWLCQIVQLLLGAVEMNMPAKLHPEDFRTMPAEKFFGTYANDPRIGDVMVDDELESFMAGHQRFYNQLGDVKVRDILEPLGNLQHTDTDLAHDIWIAFFPLCWIAIPKDDRADIEKGLVALLTKDHHYRQIDRRPNCVQTMLEGIAHTKPRLRFPPHVLKYLARTYNVWYTAAHSLEQAAIQPIVDTPTVRESNLDALVEIYAGLQEEDLFYGTWRRRADYLETNTALSYEQMGMWDKAQQMYEAAQIKARTGAMPFSQGEYMLWEDHWVACAQKLQQWEILSDFAKHENFNDLYLEAMWRNFDAWTNPEQREQLDSIIKAVSDAPTPRRMFFQAFMSLLKLHAKTERHEDFNRICDEAVQLSIRKWYQLPKRITNAHIPVLQSFQNLVELHDASVICQSLAQTTQANLDVKSQELKLLLGTWRDRLPNFWDDINAWQDLVTWRQHIFQLINGVYLHLLPPQQGNATGSSYAYRGYHETAWIINRFAHVARKHNLPEVCISQLSRIYTLPNIEIQEAFLKLREQAKCHYQNKAELNSGLDVINNTNLNYFGQQQKAEFYTLKGMFLNKLGQTIEANEAFGSALYFDIKLPKAWAEWGHYNDMLFKEDPTDLNKAASAISCYLEAASQFKNAKSRKLLGRTLWLLSLDSAEHQLARCFEEFKGDTPVWYWITYIPQLLTSLSRQEAPIARAILGKIAKTYPQALYFQLRTSREDMHMIRKQQEAKEAKEKAARERQKQQGQPGQSSPENKQSSPSRPNTANGDNQRPGTANSETAPDSTPNNNAAGNVVPKVEENEISPKDTAGTPTVMAKPRQPWEYTEELMSALKTAFPLLALSMETMTDQIQKHFKCPPDEDAYRLIVALLNDGLSYVGRAPNQYATNMKLPPSTEQNIDRFAQSILPPHIRKSFELDFVKEKPTMYEYIQKLRKWRNRFEERLDHRCPTAALESYSAHLSEFKYQKFDEVEVPGQYLQHRDKNQDFIRIERFLPDVELVRGIGFCHRRLKIRGHDGSIHPFAIQHPAARHSRREERILQLFRIFNGVLLKRKESRRRNLQFHLPLMVPLSPNVRMVQDDASYITLQGIYEDHCRRNGGNKDDPILFTVEKLRSLSPKNIDQANAIRLETFRAIQEKFVEPTVAYEYFAAIYPSFDDFWLFRRAFSYQFAALTFITYMMSMNQRYPHKLSISRSSGRVWGSELIPAMAGQKPFFQNPEPVPFRLTPNLQTLMGPIFTEGIFAPALMAIARCLTEPEGELEMMLSVFVRDEMWFWYTQQHRGNLADGQLRDNVQANSEQLVKRVRIFAEQPSGNLPVNQTIVDFIGKATNPEKLCQTDLLWMGYL